MNPLLTITGYPPSIGGAQLYTHRLAAGMHESGHDVRVTTQWDTIRRDWLIGTTLRAPAARHTYTVDGVPIQRLGLSPAEKARLAPFALGYLPFQGWATAGIARTLIDKLSHPDHTPHLIHNVRMGREGLSAASYRLSRRLGVPFVFSPLHHPRWGGWLHRHFHALYRTADALIALTEAERHTLIGLGAHPERVHVTGMGPVLADESDGARFRAAYGLGERPMVLFLGQHYRYKGLEALLEAAPIVWQQHPEAQFVFIGPPTRFSEQIMPRHTDRRTHAVGKVDLQTKTDALAACDVLCVPSLQESFGGVYVEAWAFGKPVIGGDIPAIRDVITDGVDGFTVPQKPSPIAERITRLLADPTLRRQMGEAGRQKLEARYTWERLVTRTLEIYAQVVDTPPPTV